MLSKRIASLFRSAKDFRVEACFLAALGFTLLHEGYHDKRALHVTTSHETVVQVEPVHIGSIHGAPTIARTRHPAVGESGERVRIVTGVPVKLKHGKPAPTRCAATTAARAAAAGGTCKVVRVAPADIAPVVVAPVSKASAIKGS